MQDLSYNVEVNGKQYQLSKDDTLLDMNAWDSDILSWLADKAGISLGEEHHAALSFIRETYAERQRHPVVRLVASHLAEQFGADRGTPKHFYDLFPEGVAQASRLAGIPVRELCF